MVSMPVMTTETGSVMVGDVGPDQGSEGEGLHGEDADTFGVGDGDDLVLEGAEVGVHDVDGHLQGVEVEALLFGIVDHVQVDGGVLVAGESDVADLAGFAGGDGGFHAAAGGEDGFRVVHADDLVDLDEVDHVSLETAE